MRRCKAILVWALLVPLAVWAQSSAELRSVTLEPAPDGLFLSAHVRIDLAPALEDALLKGVALTFLAEAQVLQDRWYWYDKNVSTSQRRMRLSYQPLTRRWRLSVSSGAAEASSNASLSQSFDQLADALAAVGRISGWRVADGGDIEADAKHSVIFRFKLDTSQLPRPMQIGVSANSEWNIAVQSTLRPASR